MPCDARACLLLLLGACALPAPAPPPAGSESVPEQAEPEADEAVADETATDESTTDEEPAQDATLTGDWGGARPWLAEHGLTVEASITADTARVVGGGVEQRSTTQALLDLGAGLDLEQVAGWTGASAWAEWWTRPGRLLNDDVGDWQGTSNIDTPHQHEWYELWIEAWPAPDALRMKLGKLDAFDEFAVVEAAAEFLNNGMAYSPTLSPMPSYPDPAFAALLFAYPAESTWLGIGAFDGATQAGKPTGTHGPSTFLGSPSDLFLVGEAGHSWAREGGRLAGRAAAGAWRHNGDFARFTGGGQDGATGVYALLEQELWLEAPDEADSAQGLTAFAQLAVTDEDVIEVARHLAAGLQWVGPIADHDDDILGFGATRVDFTGEPGAGFTTDHELALEVFYRWQATPSLAIKPDAQYVLDPGGDPTLENAFVLTLRFEVTL